jgi:hypothetical protein
MMHVVTSTKIAHLILDVTHNFESGPPKEHFSTQISEQKILM